ncbi:MAG: hypothetical protein RI897_3565 [Verrucomicrobiota bacterium]
MGGGPGEGRVAGIFEGVGGGVGGEGSGGWA